MRVRPGGGQFHLGQAGLIVPKRRTECQRPRDHGVDTGQLAPGYRDEGGLRGRPGGE
jgi:hypothetical protein